MTSGGKESSHFAVRSVLGKNTSNAHGLLVCHVAGTMLSAPFRLIYWIFTTAFEGGTVTNSLCRRERWGTGRSGSVPAATQQQWKGRPPAQAALLPAHPLSPTCDSNSLISPLMYIKYSALDFCKVLGRSLIKGFLKAPW